MTTSVTVLGHRHERRARNRTIESRDVRTLAGKTRSEVAKASAVAQGELSRLERRRDHRVSTLRQYVEALGGELRIVAQFGNRSVRVKGV
jgi:transcriptional regulator with XRE-family HTH domain